MLLIHVFTAKHNPACHLLGRSRLNPSVTASLRLPFLLCIDFPGLHGSWCEGVSLPLRILTQVVQASFSRPLRKIAIIDQDYSISLSLEPYYLCQRKIFSADPRIKKSSQGAKLAANSPNQGRYWRGRGLPRCVKLDSFTLQSSFLSLVVAHFSIHQSTGQELFLQHSRFSTCIHSFSPSLPASSLLLMKGLYTQPGKDHPRF